MTSETQLKQERHRLFSQWHVLAEQIEIKLAGIVSGPLELVSYENYLEFERLYKQLGSELKNSHDDTSFFIYDNCYNRWIENGEIE